MAIEFGKGITLAGGFDLGAKAPLDSRLTVATIEDRDAHVTGNRAYEGMLVYVEADKVTYQYVADEEGNLSWKEFGFNEADFLAHVANDLTTNDASKALSAAQGVALKGLIDAEAEAAREAEEGLQTAIDELGAHVGELPEGTSATSVIDYVNIKTAGIATDAALEELNNQVSGLQTTVQGIEADYLTSEDKTELSGLVTTEKERAMGVEEGLRTDVDTIAADYLKKADKTELEGKINLKADQSALDEVSGVANAAVKQSDYDTKVKALEDEDARIVGLVDAEVERATGVEAGLEGRLTKVEAFFDTKDAEGNTVEIDKALDTLVEIQKYISEDGTAADKMVEDIAANAKAIEDMEVAYKDADTNLQKDIDKNKEDIASVAGRMTTAEGKISGLEGSVAAKAEKTYVDEQIQALQGEDTSIKGRLDTLESAIGESGSVADDIATAKQEAIDTAAGDATSKANTAESNAKAHATNLNTAMNTRVEALEAIDHSHDNKTLLDSYTQTEENLADAVAKKHSHTFADSDVVEAISKKHSHSFVESELNNIASGDVAKWNEAYGKRHEHSNKSVLDGITSEKVSAWDSAESNAQAYTDAEINKVENIIGSVDSGKTVIGMLTEMREACEAGETQAVADAQAYTDTEIGKVNATIGTVASDKTVVGLINDAVTTAASDATSKANTAETNAKGYTDEEIGRVEGVISTLQGVVNGKAAQSEVNTISGKVTTLEGKVSTLESEMDAVEAKASANETAIGNLQTAVSGKAAQSDLDGVVARVDAFELWQESFEPITDADIEALFEA